MLDDLPLFQSYPEPPALPKSVRYWDDFEEKFVTIDDLETEMWEVVFDGILARLTFPPLPQHQRLLLKAVTADLIVSRSAKTAASYVSGLRSVDAVLLSDVIQSIGADEPSAFIGKWTARYRSSLKGDAARAIRYILHCACKWSYGAWRYSDTALVRALPGYSMEKYKAAQEGSCFVPLIAQSKIIDFIDETALRALQRTASPVELHRGAILALSFQYGLRRGQIARLGAVDVVRHDEQPVHIRVRLLKQRGQARARTVVRSVQAGWTPIFLELLNHPLGPEEKFFRRRPAQISNLIKKLAGELTGKAYSASDFRHTAAQRLVDSGASREEVTDFLGHSVQQAGGAGNRTRQIPRRSPTALRLAVGPSPLVSAMCSPRQRGELPQSPSFPCLVMDPGHAAPLRGSRVGCPFRQRRPCPRRSHAAQRARPDVLAWLARTTCIRFGWKSKWRRCATSGHWRCSRNTTFSFAMDATPLFTPSLCAFPASTWSLYAASWSLASDTNGGRYG